MTEQAIKTSAPEASKTVVESTLKQALSACGGPPGEARPGRR